MYGNWTRHTYCSIFTCHQLFGYALNKSKSIKADGQQSAEVKTELGYIRKGVDDIRIDLKASEKQMVALGERVTRVEESTKQAHKRLDTIEKENN